MVNQAEQVLIQKLAIGMQSKSFQRKYSFGFTLFEILIVLTIIGITLGFALIAFGDFGQKRRILFSAEQFANHIKFVQHQAILEGGTLGIKILPKGYKTLRFDAKGIWQNISKKSLYIFQPFPRDALITLKAAKRPQNEPEIIFNSSGDASSLTIYFNTDKNKEVAHVTINHDGRIDVHE